MSAAGEGVPAQRASYGGDIPARWWEVFRSEHLNELIEYGILQNADLEAAEAAVRIAQANALAARGPLFPQVLANFNASRQQTPTQALTTNAASRQRRRNGNKATVGRQYRVLGPAQCDQDRKGR